MANSSPTKLLARRGAVLITSAATSALLFSGLPAAAAEDAGQATTTQGVHPASGPSDDAEAIRQAADDFSADDTSSAVALAEAAAAQAALPLVETSTGAVASPSAAFTLTVAPHGDITMTVDGGETLGIEIATHASNVEVVDGAVVASGVATSTELVTRATDAGVQVVAILADESAPSDIVFPLNLPEGAELAEQPDGSILILGPVEYDVALPGEEERVADSAREIIGGEVDSLDDLDTLTDEQIEQLAAIPEEQMQAVIITETIAEIAAPWAVDADGTPLPTYYSVEGSTIVQTVETTADTAFPVVADPSWLWWIEKGAKCVGGVIALGAAGYAKVSVGIAKLVVMMKQAKAATSLGKAYTAWKKLGSSNSAIFKELVNQIKALGNMVVKHGYSGIAKHRASSTRAAASITLLKEGARVVAGVFGLGACYEMLTA